MSEGAVDSLHHNWFGYSPQTVVTDGYAPTLNQNVNAATNRIATGDETYTFYTMGGQRMAEYSVGWFNDTLQLTETRIWRYFGGRLLARRDRLGSVSRNGTGVGYFPYGEEKPADTAQDRDKFATYYRDASGLDYAMNRYYDSSTGRFTSPDPYQASAGVENPASWNRYAYVEGDPVNFGDPRGLAQEDPNACETGHQCVTVAASGPDPLVTYMMWLHAFGGSGDGRTARARAFALGDELDTAGAGAGPKVKRGSTQGRRQQQIRDAISALRKTIDADCKAWLESGPSYKDFDAYIDALTGANLIGWGTITSTTGDSDNIAAVTGANDSGLAIVIQANGAFFNSDFWVGGNASIRGNSARARIFILLHEFAHSMEIPGFEHDAGDPAAGRRNDDRVRTNCEKTLGSFQ